MSKRVPKGGMYYHITYQAGKFRIVNLHDLRGNESNANLSCGNYFLDYSKAAEVADKFHAILKEYCDVENEFLSMNITDCDFPIRAIHQLENAGITTVSKLVTFTRKDLREKGVGPKTSVQIEEALNCMGLKLNY